MGKQRIDSWIGAALSLLAFVVYVLTLSPGAYPGESASLIVQNTGLFPRPTPDHPLWGALAWLVSRIPAGTLALKLNLLSALCGAASIGLVYRLTAGGLSAAITIDASNRSRAELAVRLGGISAALCFAFCIPFWVVSNRAHNASLDVLLLLVVTWCFYQYARTGREGLSWLFAFLYGLGVVEFATFIVFAPLFGLSLVFLLWKNEVLNARTVIRVVVPALAGLSLYFIAAAWFCHSSGYALRGYEGYFQIVWIMWRDQVFLIGRSLPQSGWLIVLITTVVPWLTCLVVAKRGLNDEKDWTYYILHVVITGLAIGVLFNMKFAPWPMLGFGRLLVTPYLLLASVFGYLVAYWFLLPWGWGEEVDSRAGKWTSRHLGSVLALSAMSLLVLAPFKNLQSADGRPASFISVYSREVVRSMAGRSWLITDGSLDTQLMVAAADLRYPLRLLNLNAGGNEVYMRYVANQFESPRLKNLAQVGVMPLLEEWFRMDREVGAQVAVQATPDLWMKTGFLAVPHRLVFLGVKDLRDVDPAAMLLEQDKFWKEAVPPLLREAEHVGSLGYMKQRVLRQMGLMANNAGVLLEDLERKDDAFRAYSKAREIDEGNISALLNQTAMIDHGYPASSADTIKDDLKKVLAARSSRLAIWSLSQDYGYVRMPQAFAQLGWIWALSGQPGLAVSGLKRAMDLLPESKKSMVKQTLAGVYLLQEEDEESEGLYSELLMEDPENAAALVGLARIASRKGDPQRAQELLSKAQEAGLSKDKLALEQASLRMRGGDLPEARKILQDVVSAGPHSGRAWSMLLWVLIRQNDDQALQETIERIETIEGKGNSFMAALANGHLLMRKNDWSGARTFFERAVALSPDNLHAMELLLRLDVLQVKSDRAVVDVKRLLNLDPDNAFGNYIMGSLRVRDKEYVLAEDAFRRSLRQSKSPLVMNDLAWVLQERGKYAEAETLVRASIGISGKTFQPWDTLGVILMKARRLDESERAFQQALAFFDGDITLFLHMTELYVMKKNKARALEIIQTIMDKKFQLSLEDQDRLDSLRRSTEEM